MKKKILHSTTATTTWFANTSRRTKEKRMFSRPDALDDRISAEKQVRIGRGQKAMLCCVVLTQSLISQESRGLFK